MNTSSGSKEIPSELDQELSKLSEKFTSLDIATGDFILYIGKTIDDHMNHESSLAIVQMQIRIFDDISKIRQTQEWIIKTQKEIQEQFNILQEVSGLKTKGDWIISKITKPDSQKH